MMSTRKLFDGRQSGDTIVEVLLSMTILALVGVTAFATSTRSFHSSINSQLRDQGIAYAQQQVELLKNIDNGAASMSTYSGQTGAFCVNPSDLGHPTAATGAGCAMSSADFKVSDKYDSSTRTFTVTTTWTSANGQSTQSTLYYKPGTSYVTCTGSSCTPITPPTTSTVTNPPAYSINISSPTSMPIPYNGSIKLIWNTSNITPGSCQAVGSWTGDLGGGSASDTSAGYTVSSLTSSPLSFDIKCKDLTGVYRTSNSGPVAATVSPAPAVVFNYFKSTVDPANIEYNTAANLIWSTTNATSCSGSGGSGFNTGGATNNSTGVSTGPLTANTTYTLTCTRASGISDSTTYTVKVNPQPAVSYFYPGSTPVCSGCGTYLYWGSSNATQCYSPSFGYVGTSGSWWTGGLGGPANYTYQIECQGVGGTWTAWSSTTVHANAPPASVSYFYPGSSNVCYGCGTSIYWGSSNATQCYSPSTGYIGTSGSWGTGALYGPGTWTYQVECMNSDGVWTAWSYTSVSAPGNPPPPCWSSAGTSGSSGRYYLSGGGGSCGYWLDSVVGWNGTFSNWGPTGSNCHTQQGGADPWGWLSSASSC